GASEAPAALSAGTRRDRAVVASTGGPRSDLLPRVPLLSPGPECHLRRAGGRGRGAAPGAGGGANCGRPGGGLRRRSGVDPGPAAARPRGAHGPVQRLRVVPASGVVARGVHARPLPARTAGPPVDEALEGSPDLLEGHHAGGTSGLVGAHG